MFRMGTTSPGARASKLFEPMWTLFFELHTGPWRISGHIMRPDTRAIEAPSRKSSRRITLQYRGHPHTPRVCPSQRPITTSSSGGFKWMTGRFGSWDRKKRSPEA